MAIEFVVNDDDLKLSIRAKYRFPTGGVPDDEGVTVAFYDTTGPEPKEFSTFDLFKLDPHYHPNRDPDNPRPSVLREEGMNADGLLEYLLEKKTLPVLAEEAGQNRIALGLNGKRGVAVKGLVYKIVVMASNPIYR